MIQSPGCEQDFSYLHMPVCSAHLAALPNPVGKPHLKFLMGHVEFELIVECLSISNLLTEVRDVDLIFAAIHKADVICCLV